MTLGDGEQTADDIHVLAACMAQVGQDVPNNQMLLAGRFTDQLTETLTQFRKVDWLTTSTGQLDQYYDLWEALSPEGYRVALMAILSCCITSALRRDFQESALVDIALASLEWPGVGEILGPMTARDRACVWQAVSWLSEQPELIPKADFNILASTAFVKEFSPQRLANPN